MCPRLLTWSLCLISLILFRSDTVSAQQKIQIFRGTEATDGSQKNVLPGVVTGSRQDPAKTDVSPPGTTPTADGPAAQPPAYSPEAAARIQLTSARLAERSFDSFRRGLMPLHDHLDQLRLVADSEFRVLSADPAGEVEVAARHLQRIRRVERALADFNEPNAVGWRADLFLARALLAQAEYDLAAAQGNTANAEIAAQQARLLAERHLIERRHDWSIGLASLPTLLHAEMLTPGGAARGRELLAEAIRTTRRWNQVGAGIGRADQVAAAEFELARFDFFLAFDSDDQDIGGSLQAARQASQRILKQQMEYYRNGTASLYEISRNWQNMREILEYASSTEAGVSQETIDESQAVLGQIVELAGSKSDSRGRIAADLAYISLAKDVATAEQDQ